MKRAKHSSLCGKPCVNTRRKCLAYYREAFLGTLVSPCPVPPLRRGNIAGCSGRAAVYIPTRPLCSPTHPLCPLYSDGTVMEFTPA